ncbi:hypothetical protein B296_00033656, partial [Ensete ventricosum]
KAVKVRWSDRAELVEQQKEGEFVELDLSLLLLVVIPCLENESLSLLGTTGRFSLFKAIRSIRTVVERYNSDFQDGALKAITR